MTSERVEFYRDIRPLFSEGDRQAMLFMMDLHDYKDCREHATAILESVASRRMPCEPDRKWSEAAVSLFRRWRDSGCPEGALGTHETSGWGAREWFYHLMNLEEHPWVYGAARTFVETQLARTRQWIQQNDARLARPTSAHEKDVSEIADLDLQSPTVANFERHLEAIYQRAAQAAAELDVQSCLFQTALDVDQRVLQNGPFNLTDGSWLRGSTPVGPLDEVSAALLGIWLDEVGEGLVERNHAVVYRDLLESRGFTLPPVHSAAFAQDARLWPESYESPNLQLAISLYPRAFLPEILGMTLWLEWGAPFLRATISLLRRFDVDPTFYVLHQAIDNAASGHGAVAKRAVLAHLDAMAALGVAREDSLARVWCGYVAFARSIMPMWDRLAAQLALEAPTDRTARVLRMIAEKAPYAARNHGQLTLGKDKLDALFADPPRLLAALRDSGRIVPGKPDESPLVLAFGFHGKMYKVFSDEEQALWRDYITDLAGKPDDAALDESARTVPEEAMLEALYAMGLCAKAGDSTALRRHRPGGRCLHSLLATGQAGVAMAVLAANLAALQEWIDDPALASWWSLKGRRDSRSWLAIARAWVLANTPLLPLDSPTSKSIRMYYWGSLDLIPRPICCYGT